MISRIKVWAQTAHLKGGREMSNTKGPWRVVKDDYADKIEYYVVVDLAGQAVQVAGPIIVKEVADLIAAAPQLLEAVSTVQQGLADGSIQFTQKRLTDTDPYHPANTKMCAAIAKVEGR